jgi:hypothetical protein
MVTPVLKAKFDELGVPLIPLESGARHFVAELLQASPTEIEVVIGGMPQHAPLIAAPQPATRQPAIYDVMLRATTDPYLLSHQVNGVVVLPLVLVQEWFLRAANAADDMPGYNALRKLRVLKGIPLPAFGDQPTRLRIHLEWDATDPTVRNVMLYDGTGVARFAAQVVRSATAADPHAIIVASEAWPTVNIAGAQLYNEQLFHGPAFATLQTIDRLGEHGARATLSNSRAVSWEDLRSSPLTSYVIDPALIDGGLQLARVWGYDLFQQLTLPTAIDTFVVYEPGMLAAGRNISCIVEGKPIGQAGTRTNLWYIDTDSGALIAAVHGLEMYVSSESPRIQAGAGKAS